MNRQIVIIIIVAVVFFGAGFVSSNLMGREPVDTTDTFQHGWEAAKKRLIETNPYLAEGSNLPKTQVTGKIVKINGKNITVSIVPLEPLADPDLDERILTTDNKTKVYHYVETKAENQDFVTGLHNPDEFVGGVILAKEEVGISKIEEGQRITVITDKDIRKEKSFYTKEIILEK